MSDPGPSPLQRFEFHWPEPHEITREAMKSRRQKSFRLFSEWAMRNLIDIYAKDQIIGKSIHDAYRKAISAVIDGAENVDELIADIKSTQAKVTASENQLQFDDELVKSFSQEAKTTADSIELLSQSNYMTARSIYRAACDVMKLTKENTPTECVTAEQYLAKRARNMERDRMRRQGAMFANIFDKYRED